jgi:aminopeptidase N
LRPGLIALSLLAACASGAAVQAKTLQPAPAQPLAASVPSDLPRVARPRHYRIAIEPDAERLTFTGTVAIELDVFEPVDELTLHAHQLAIASARLTSAAGGRPLQLRASPEPARQRLTLHSPRTLTPGAYVIEIAYRGTISTQASGLFALDYPDKQTGKSVRALYTQFEPADARSFAPMFDEPSYKATFDLAAVVPADRMAIGNMPIADEEALPGGRKRVTFATTPRMSSYLLFFALGVFERLTAAGPYGIELGVVSPAGSGEQARYALEATPALLDYYTDYFGLPYPLPKLDNVAAPGRSQFFGAMENWGAILTFERYLLLDPAHADPHAQAYIHTTLAHEVAHQWFGNIVTMAWWDDLWLNEGFASWMEIKASARFHPEWYPMFGRINGRENAMAIDAIATTQPVIRPVGTVAEATEAFDAIAYSKGAAVIAMLEAYAGEDTWRSGIRRYLASHRYGNTTSEDLWRAVEQAGATELPAIAHDFTHQPGVPLIEASAECRGNTTVLSLSQGEFSRDRAAEVAAQPQRWRVPLLIRTGAAAPVRHLLEGTASIELPGCGAVIVNGGQLGYFRTRYTPALVQELTAAMPALEPIDQLGLLTDQFALAEAGYQPLAQAIALLDAVPDDANPLVAQGALARWGAIYGQAGAEERPRIAALARARWLPRLARLGYEPRADEPLPETSLRAALLATLSNMGEETVIAEARRRLQSLTDDRTALDGPLKSTWLGIAARHVDPAGWELLARLARTAPDAVERHSAFESLGRASDPALADRALALALSGEAGTASAAILSAVAAEHPDRAIDLALANRTRVEALVDTGARSGYIASLAANSYDPAMIEKLEALRASLAPNERGSVERQLAALRARIDGLARLSSEIRDWLGADPS